MHRAFLIPEIVAAIIESARGERGYLHTCLLINRLFFEETCRILWYGCGWRYDSTTAGHVTPGIYQLAGISKRSGRERAQVYANFIKSLSFSGPGPTDPFGNEAKRHILLAYLQYPQLREVSFHNKPDKAPYLNEGDVIINYAQPSLREFQLHDGGQLSDAFLDNLRTRCPNLTCLTLSSSVNTTITQDGLLRFLYSYASLKYLTLKIGFGFLWTREAFCAVGQYADLEQLGISIIHDGWIQQDETMFPTLKYLNASISTTGLGLLSRQVPNLTTLHVRLQSPCTRIETLATYSRLQELVIDLGIECKFSGANLLLIAENCPELRKLEVDGGLYSEVNGLDDPMMEKIARCLPNIKTLKLETIKTDKPLTIQSIKSLGHHCQSLKELSLSSIEIDWEDSDGDNSAISSSIWSMALLLHDDQTPLWFPYDDEENQVWSENMAGLAERFARRFPKMKYFDLVGGEEGEIELGGRIEGFISDRMYDEE